MTAERRRRILVALCVALVAGSIYVQLGLALAHGAHFAIDAAGRRVAGEFPALAELFTQSCLWPTLTVLSIIGIVVATRSPQWRGRIIFAIATTLVTWQTSDALKNAFARQRPAYWIVHRETSFAYSSGHAMFAVLVYWLWAYFIARSALPFAVRIIATPLLAAWGAGVIWSRLALGAHYVTDLIGGVLLAAVALGVASIVATVARAAPTDRRGSQVIASRQPSTR